MTALILMQNRSSPSNIALWRDRLNFRDLEETARVRFKLNNPLIIASYLSPENERFVLSSDDDIDRLYEEVAAGEHPSNQITVELETLETFLQHENADDNGGVIQKVVQELILDRHPLSANTNQTDFGTRLNLVLSELRRLGLSENWFDKLAIGS